MSDIVLLKDKDVRSTLHRQIKEKFINDDSTYIIDELQICNGVARVDVAVINNAFRGYEIKSDCDTLNRLPNQIEQYNKAFDYMNLVCGEKYIEKATKMIPEWWGIYLVSNINGTAQISIIKESDRNKNIEPFTILQFLNKNELINFGIQHNIGSYSALNKIQKYKLWKIFAEKINKSEIDMNDLLVYFHEVFINREDCRAVNVLQFSP